MLALGWGMTAFAAETVPDRTLAYPDTPADAGELARQVYFVNHFLGVDNIAFGRVDDAITVFANRAPGRKALFNTAERYLNNDYSGGPKASMDLAVFRSGRLKGTGILVSLFRDPERSPEIALWLPALRKVRRITSPALDDRWPGTDLTYGDIYLRRPGHERHELLGAETFGQCLGRMDLVDESGSAHRAEVPEDACVHRDRKVYRLKSDTRFKNWWYDYRVRYVDTVSFADYRGEYYKDGRLIKTIDKDWRGMGLADPRAQYIRLIYSRSDTGHESMVAIPREVITWNTDMPDRFWSIKTLRGLKR